MASVNLINTVNGYEDYIQSHGIDEEVINAYIKASQAAILTEKDIQYGLKVSNRSKELINSFVLRQTDGMDIWRLERYQQDNGTAPYELVNKYYEIMKLESEHLFESFMLYMEKNRPYKERFYQPREIPLKRVADGIQKLVDDELDELFVNCPSRVGKTQIVKMGYLWYGSKFPEMSNLYTAYSDKITSGFYDGLIELMTDPTYTYAELFPKNVEKKLITDGKDLTIDLIRKKTYPTFTMRSIYGTLNGACDCSGLAVADDLFSGIEEALSTDRQITVWGKFDNNFMKRLKRKAKLINMGTRWAPKDVQGRRKELLESNEKYKNRRWDAVIIPALNENDESNFDYPYDLGYSTEDYHMIRASFEENDDMASWDAQDQQDPTERHGMLFPPESMLTFEPEKDLPDREPDRIFAAVDEAYGGGDYVAMPICYQYNDFFYIIDVVFNNGDKKVTRPLIVEKCMKYHVRTIRFEETKTTSDYREWCEKEWKEKGYQINSFGKAAPNNIAKKDRIFNKAPEIKEMYFLHPSLRSKEYNAFLKNMREFKMEGKVKNDDAPDSMAQLCDMKFERRRKTVIMEGFL